MCSWPASLTAPASSNLFPLCLHIPFFPVSLKSASPPSCEIHVVVFRAHLNNWYVLLCSSHHAKYHRLGGLENRTIIVTLLKAESPRSGPSRVQSLVRAVFVAYRQLPSHIFTWRFLGVYTWEEQGPVRESSLITFHVVLILLYDCI